MRTIVPFFRLTAILLALVFPALSLYAEERKLNVISTIKPLHALVLAVAEGHVNAHLLIPDFASPHHYSLKPSDLRKIAQADLIFRIDPAMEVMLNRLFKESAGKAKVISLADSPGIRLLPIPSASSGGHSHVEKDSHDSAADRHTLDMHIWTSPQNAQAMIRQIALILGQHDPEKRATYDANAARTIDKLQLLKAEMLRQLAPYKDKPYLVFHNSWQYFAQAFGLREPLVASQQERVLPGARSIPRIRAQMASQSVGCLFTQPNMNQGWVKTLTESFADIKQAEIDVTASRFAANESTYLDWLRYMGVQIESCLK